MLRVGLTGGIGAGKSAVADKLDENGAVIVDADRLAREVIAPGTPGHAELLAAFGTDDRPTLAARVFADPEARRTLEEIIHPRVRAATEDRFRSAPADAIVVNDVPLLVETGLPPTYHLVLVVEADRVVRLDRLLARGLPREAAEARMAAQASDEARRAAADVLLDNAQTLGVLHERVDALWPRLRAFEDNLRHARVATLPPNLELHQPDPDWPASYARTAARIRHALGADAVTLDHIGSTAVPGLKAKNVIDVQLGVEDLDAVAGRLAAAGYPAREGEWWDNPRPPDPGPWPKRLHGSADPGNLVNLHVRRVGSPGWRWATMFRDWLRANPEEAARYAEEKDRLAARGLTVAAYAEAKEPWFAEAGERAEAWSATHPTP